MSMSNQLEFHLDFITFVNINNMCNGEFSYPNAKDLMSYLKTVMLMQQHFFWKRHKESYHDASTIFTVILLYELFTHYNGCNPLQSLNPYFQQITGFDGTTNSKYPHLWMCWIMNKTILCLMHLNSVKPNLTMHTVNLDLLTSSVIKECKNQTLKFNILIPSYVNIKITIVNACFGYSDVNRILYTVISC